MNKINPFYDKTRAWRLFDALAKSDLTLNDLVRLRIGPTVRTVIRAIRRWVAELDGAVVKVGGRDPEQAFRLSKTYNGSEIVSMKLATESRLLEGDRPMVEKSSDAPPVKEVVKYAKTLTIKIGSAAPVKLDAVHKCMPDLLECLAMENNPVWVAGPAGAGKTTAFAHAAKVLRTPFYFNGAIDNEYKLSGFVDAHGKIVSTAFRRCYTGGGLYLFDEVDASLPSATLAFNAALSNGWCDFPGISKSVEQHKDFRCGASANTWGFGGSANYVGRYKQDDAFLDRFVAIAWDYDEELERQLAGNDDWTSRVQRWRSRAREAGIKVVISPRASIKGARMLAAGHAEEKVIDRVLRNKVGYETFAKIDG